MKYNFTAMHLCCLLSIILLFSCKSKKQDFTSHEYSTYFEVSADKNEKQIAFLLFSMKRDSTLNKNTVSLKEKNLVPGIMKNDNSPIAESRNDLFIEVYEDNILRETFYTENPLYKRVEYVSEDSQLTTKTIETDESDFFIRVQINKANTNIIIYETLENEIRAQIFTLKLS